MHAGGVSPITGRSLSGTWLPPAPRQRSAASIATANSASSAGHIGDVERDERSRETDGLLPDSGRGLREPGARSDVSFLGEQEETEEGKPRWGRDDGRVKSALRPRMLRLFRVSLRLHLHQVCHV